MEEWSGLQSFFLQFFESTGENGFVHAFSGANVNTTVSA